MRLAVYAMIRRRAPAPLTNQVKFAGQETTCYARRLPSLRRDRRLEAYLIVIFT